MLFIRDTSRTRSCARVMAASRSAVLCFLLAQQCTALEAEAAADVAGDRGDAFDVDRNPMGGASAMGGLDGFGDDMGLGDLSGPPLGPDDWHPGKPLPPPAPAQPVETDVPFIQCATCKALVKRAFFVTKQWRDSLKKMKLTEEMILSSLGGLCDVNEASGEWIHWYDMVEDGRAINLKKMSYVGDCDVKCATIALACSETLNDIDTEVATALYMEQQTVKEAQPALCESFCSKPQPLTPEDRLPGRAFQAKPKGPSEYEHGLTEASRPKKGKKQRKKKKPTVAKQAGKRDEL